jgi:hypothetical protein
LSLLKHLFSVDSRARSRLHTITTKVLSLVLQLETAAGHTLLCATLQMLAIHDVAA